jgi:transcriptional regulator with XRE-family HTH domain
MTLPERRRPARTGRVAASPSLIDEFESTAAGAQEMAAARLAENVAQTFRQALTTIGIRQADLAERVAVTPGRVSQLLADGNLRISTIGRFARALGYQARIVFDPVDAHCPSLPSRAWSRPTSPVRSSWQDVLAPWGQAASSPWHRSTEEHLPSAVYFLVATGPSAGTTEHAMTPVVRCTAVNDLWREQEVRRPVVRGVHDEDLDLKAEKWRPLTRVAL